jgi:hypothetical protein
LNPKPTEETVAKRGRKTAGELEKVESIPARPEPPSDLTEFEKEVWRKAASGLPADWFGDETLDLLRLYCRHMLMFEELTDEVNANWDELPPSEKVRLLKQREVETRAALSVATKLRITKQSTVLPDKSKKPDKPSVPWRTRS